MRRKALRLFLLLCCSPLFAQVNLSGSGKAQHEVVDRKWAQKTGLPVNEVQAVRIAAGISDDSRGSSIANIDAISLKQRNHILLVEGPCVRLHVIERHADSFTEAWSLTQLPSPAWKPDVAGSRSSRGICPLAPRPPSAHATADGRIVLEVPILMDAFQRTLPVNTYIFAWGGSKYVLVNDER
jgi:hypothetical protein